MATTKKVSKVSYAAFVASSIDGRIAEGERTKLNWTSLEDWQFFQNSLKKFDAVVAGHNTYRMAEKNLKKRNTIVFTSQVKQPEISGSVTFFNPERSNFKKLCQDRRYKSVAILGGPKVYDFFLERGLLDIFFVTIEPYVFTAGVPMFTGTKFKKYRFTLARAKKLNRGGTMLLKYKRNAD